MALRLYNTLTQKLEPFEPREPGRVGIYVCGITPYEPGAHAGHARVYVAFDVLVRHLRARGFEVNYTRNITDYNDNILKRAKSVNEDPVAFAARMWTFAEHELLALGCDKPSHEPRVSTHIPEIIALVEEIVASGHAYVVDTPKGKDVYFEVRKFPPYGKLSHRNINDLLAGARVEVGEVKKDPLDFALWKASAQGEFGWDSPWGRGCPGWHIECSAMSAKYLGKHFDIHCGGMDLIFPHHENEVAQSESVWGPDFSKYWLHNGFVTIDKEKMAKSLGNFVTVRDILVRNDPEALRYFLLGTHFRGPLAFDVQKVEERVSFPGVDEAERRVDYLYTTLDSLRHAKQDAAPGDGPPTLKAQAKVVAGAREAVLVALDKDLNTPQALAVLADLAKAGNEIAAYATKKKDAEARGLAAKAAEVLLSACGPLGLLQAPPEEFFARTRTRRLAIRKLDPAAIDAKVKARDEARAAKDFKQGDAIRAELAALGVELLDGETGTSWRVAQ
ncbi:MAG TPA: cysteine--tRNA ligase [Polyangiaceae bacterium]|nr:cysteine--tRNA ligase [Polyangiaceae bacterium]